MADFKGGMFGSVSYAFRRDDGVVLALIYNHGVEPLGEPFFDLEVLSQLLDFPDYLWPEGDRFSDVGIDVSPIP